MTRRIKELRLPVGIDAQGKVETIAIGYVLETDYGQGNVARDFELCISVLNPVLFSQVKPLAGKSAYVTLEGVTFAKRYKAPTQISPPDAAVGGLASDPDAHVDSDGKDLE